MFIGRKQELKELNELWYLKKSSLVVCRGRRRIGKSQLIHEFSKTANHFYEIQGLPPRKDQTKEDQIKHFYQELYRYFNHRPLADEMDWSSALRALAKNLSKKNKVLILLDEISWMSKDEPDFAGFLKIAWDTFFSRMPNVIFVICGSVSTWIEENILSATAFVGRVSLTISLNELSLVESMKMLSLHHERSELEKIKILCLTGGIPKYIEEINPKLSFYDNVSKQFFSKNGFLFKDYKEIFNDIFLKKSESYRKIIETLIDATKSLSEIAEALEIKKGGLISKHLHDLIISGFIAEDYVYSAGAKKRKTRYYRISDNYLRFYLKYVWPHKTEIEKSSYGITNFESLHGLNSILGLQFENLLLNNMFLLLKSMNIEPSRVKSISPYIQKKTVRNKGACQIDLLIELESFEVIICEIKLRSKISTNIIGQIEQKRKLLEYPRYYSKRTALVYMGDLTNIELFEKKLDYLISVEELLA
jgi:AAA+ ATPase superfamily predicted ATPase